MIHWGILGVGNIAHRFIKSLQHSEEGVLYALASKNPQTAQRYPQARLYTDYLELLRDPKVDVVYIATPHQTHFEWIMAALEHGKHVLCEKPATLYADEIKQISSLAEEKNLFFMEAFKTKFTPAIDKLKTLLEHEDILSLEAQFCFSVPKEHARYLYDPIQGGALYDVNTYLAGFAQTFVKEWNLKNYDIHWEQGIDTNFNYTLESKEGLIKLKGSIVESLERIAIIKTPELHIVIPDFHRPTSYYVNDQIFQEDLTYDDMSGEIAETHCCIRNNRYQSEIHSHHDTYEIIKLTQFLKNSYKS